MPEHRKVLAAVLVSVTALTAASLQSTTGAAASPERTPTAAERVAAATASLERPGEPAYLTRLRQQAVRYVKAGTSGPIGPNPARALVPRPEKLDWAGWRRVTQSGKLSAARTKQQAEQQAKAKAKAGKVGVAVAAPRPRVVDEDEPVGTRGSNDTLRTAQSLGRFGTRARQDRAVRVLGRLSPAPLPQVEKITPNTEDDGSMEQARDTGVSRTRGGFETTGTIGDAPNAPDGTATEDADFYKLRLKAGEHVQARVERTSGNLEPLVLLVDSKGDSLVFPDFNETSSSLETTVRSGGDYYLVVMGWTIIYLDTGEVRITKGGYRVSATARPGDRDVYAVDLQAGDVLGGSVKGSAGYLSIFDTKGVEVHGSSQDASFIYPVDNPLPGGGNAVTEHVARTSGRHYVEVTSGSGAYDALLEVYRYGGASSKQSQTIFLDFDGQRLNTGIFGGRGVTTLSPMRSFLGKWGLSRASERALADRITATVQENVNTDLRAAGISRWVDVKVVSSLRAPDTFGKPGVTRVVVGGTIRESGIGTIGIAQSIDPGNFEREETGLVLLDALSEPRSEETPYSLNSYLTAKSDRLAFVGRAVGNVVAHEVGHMIGNWHVENSNTTANLMDSGGNFPLLFGVGRDRVGGTKDDVDVDFGHDHFSIYEGFTGIEDTLARSAWGMSRKP